MTKRPVAYVLGAGPTGQVASAYLVAKGWNVRIHTGTIPQPGGPFYFHDLPEHITLTHPPRPISYIGIGTGKTYAYKGWRVNYPSSFPGTGKRTAYGIWPSKTLQNDLLAGTEFYMKVYPTTGTASIEALAKQADLVVLTWSVRKNQSIHRTPILQASLNQVAEKWPHLAHCLESSAFIYDGSGCPEVVRVICPPVDFALGNCYVELNRDVNVLTILEAMEPIRPANGYSTLRPELDRHAASLRFVPDLHPFATPWEDIIAPNVIVAGRFARNDPKYLASDVMGQIQRWLNSDFGRGK